LNNCKTAILIVSFDKYQQLWDVQENEAMKYLSDYSDHIYLLTNKLTYGGREMLPLQVGDDESWSNGIHISCEMLRDKYDWIITILDDIIVQEKLQKSYVDNLVEIARQKSFASVSMSGRPYTKRSFFYGGVSEISRSSKYRANLVFSLWRVQDLWECSKGNMNAWQFEEYINSLDTLIYGSVNRGLRYSHLVNRGKVLRYRRFSNKYNLSDFNRMSLFHTVIFDLRVALYNTKNYFSVLIGNVD